MSLSAWNVLARTILRIHTPAWGLNGSVMWHTTSPEQVQPYLLVVDPVVHESCDKGTYTVKGLREGQPWQKTPLTGPITHTGVKLITKTEMINYSTNSTTQDGASLECNMTRPDENPLEVRPPIDHLLTAKRNTRIGAWNVRTMYQTRKANQVAYKMKKYNIHVLGLSETRWNGAGQSKLATGEHMIYSGHKDEDHAHMHGV